MTYLLARLYNTLAMSKTAQTMYMQAIIASTATAKNIATFQRTGANTINKAIIAININTFFITLELCHINMAKESKKN